MTTFAVIGLGAMGSAIAQLIVGHGARVLTHLGGRSDGTLRRARLVGATAVLPHELIRADIILSIVPPSETLAAAQFVGDAARAAKASPIYVDLNATSPKAIGDIQRVFDHTGVELFDGTIIGTPPRSDGYNPTIYISGDPEGKTNPLADYGLHLRQLDGPLGAASALKMCYAGINKGFSGLGAAMLLAAHRSGSGASLREELAASLPSFSARLTVAIPDMLPKARRWVSEMNEIREFLGHHDPASDIYDALGKLFSALATDYERKGELSNALLTSVLK